MELLPETVQSLIKRFQTSPPEFDVHREQMKIFTFQMFRALAYLHHRGIAHRDVKPSNLLVNPTEKLLKLCDFGSAKHLLPNDVSVSYICSRYYRAPELIVGCTTYTTSIDIWAGACVMTEFYAGVPIFKGKKKKINRNFQYRSNHCEFFSPSGSNPNDQFVRIMSLLGEPTREEIREMNSKSSSVIDHLIRRRENPSRNEKRTLNEYLQSISHSDRCWISFMFTFISIFTSTTFNSNGNLIG